MNRDGHNNVKYFVGGEVEHTPAHSKRTLFVVDFQDTNEIVKEARANNVTHIFLGANHSFYTLHHTQNFWDTWNAQIIDLLGRGFFVTLEYQAHEHDVAYKNLKQEIWKSRNFIPLVSVRIPHIETSSANLTIKIDDVDFKATNPGVWCMHFSEVTDSNRFTDWIEYESDQVLSAIQSTVTTKYADGTTATGVPPLPELSPEEQALAELSNLGQEIEAEILPLNNTEMGLDPNAKSALKEVKDDTPAAVVNTTPEAAADAYTKGTTSDPLAPEASAKPKSKK